MFVQNVRMLEKMSTETNPTPEGNHGNLEYAEIRKMEIKGVSRRKSEHVGESVEFHIKYCIPLIENGVVHD